VRGPDDHLLFAKPGVFARCWSEALGVVGRVGPLLGMLPWLVAQLAVLAALGTFPRPPLGAWLEPVYRLAGGEAARHYPEAWAVLPRVLDWIGRGVDWAVGTVCLAVTTAVLPGAFRGWSLSESGFPGRGLSRTGAALGAMLPSLLLAGAARIGADLVPTEGPGALPLAPAFAAGLRLADLALRVLLVYGVAAAVLGGEGPLGAIRRGVVFASHHYWTTAGFVVATALPAGALAWFRGDPRARFGPEDPETIRLWSAGEVFLTWIGALFLVATTTRLWLHHEGEEEDVGAREETP
jgi:hypothetical protein